MIRKSDTDRIKELQQKKAAIARKLSAIEAHQKKRARADDTRRKVLVGAAVLHSVKDKPDELAKLQLLLDAFLSRNDDRSLFGLPVKPEVQIPTST